jgi:hypothetical protein
VRLETGVANDYEILRADLVERRLDPHAQADVTSLAGDMPRLPLAGRRATRGVRYPADLPKAEEIMPSSRRR